MNKLEKHERKIAYNIALLYGGCSEEVYEIMFDAVKRGRLTFEGLSDILNKIYMPELTINNLTVLCDFIRRISLTGTNVNNTIKQIRTLFQNIKNPNGE